MKRIITSVILSFALFNCFSQDKPKVKLDSRIVAVEDATPIMVIGDWGRNGEFFQKKLADAMGEAATRIEPEFIISTGDNIYPDGVASVHDPLWISSFENVYSSHSLFCPWYVVLGNHDYRGNIKAEIEYSNISRRWNMPSEYFSFEKELEDGSKALFVFIDSNPLNDEYYMEEKYKDKVAGQDTTAQLIWLQKTLHESDADWKVVTGHHPFYTGGKRVDEPNAVRNHLEKLFEREGVDLYLAGHEHDLQFIKAGNGIFHIVSGAGSEVRPTGYLEETMFARASQGVAILFLKKGEIKLQFMDYKGKLLYENVMKK